MNNKEFITQLAKQTGSTQKAAAQLVDDLSNLMAGHLRNDQSIDLGTLGIIEPKTKEQRIINNPKTKGQMLVPPKITADFRPSKALKAKCNEDFSPHN